MPIWIVLFVVAFGGMELFQWVQGLTLPLPFFIATGVLLAIASNADKRAGLPWRSGNLLKGNATVKPLEATKSSPVATPQPSNPAANPVVEVATAPQPKRSPELPKFDAKPPVQKPPISFTVRKPGSSN